MEAKNLNDLVQYMQPVLMFPGVNAHYTIIYNSDAVEKCDMCNREITAGVVASDISSMYHYHEKTPERKFVHKLNGRVLIKNPERNLEIDLLTFIAIHNAIRHSEDVFFNITTERTDKLAYR
ncbi:MAG TPA: hypothetical protein VI894_02675 [Candidatus Nanoarchaeia archaeon]|nr:hypothetical protein [Candidatus Nanoarchaeia archaeon]